MGCWNKTCALSGLHIKVGDDTYVFVLEQQEEFDKCYSTGLYAPVLLPFESKYNDYGGGEQSTGAGFNAIMEAIEKNLVEVEQGSNQYHDIAIKREDFDEDLFFEGVHEGRLAISNPWRPDGVPLSFAMIRKDVLDNILENRVMEKFVGGGKGNGGWDNNYIIYKFKDIVADIPAFLQSIKNPEDNLPEEFDSITDPEQRKRIAAILNRDRGWADVGDATPNLVKYWMPRDSYRYSRLVDVKAVVSDLLIEGHDDEAADVVEQYLKGLVIDGFMHDVRRLWTPGGFEGSQSQDLDAYEILLSAMSSAIKAEKAEYEEECEA